MLLKLTRRILTTTLLGALSVTAFAADGRDDYDLDDDGLIEINDLGDLDEIRNNLDGSSLYGSSAGCPETGCNGFELTTDLDFDTNGDGKMDENDEYWNGGAGWEPIGDTENPLTASFDGNGNLISNVYIDRPEHFELGLIGVMTGQADNYIYLRNIFLAGELSYAKGLQRAAILVGRINYVGLDSVFVYGRSEAISNVGMVGVVAGFVVGGTVDRVFAQGSAVYSGDLLYAHSGAFGFIDVAHVSNVISFVSVDGSITGSVLGSINSLSLTNALGVGHVAGRYMVGGLSGSLQNFEVVSNSYWATDTTGQETSNRQDDSLNYVGATLAELKCPIAPDNTTCAEGKNLYAGWSTDIWDFGTEEQLPGMIIGDIIFRDSDGDGNLDVNTQPSVSLRLTQDGTEETTIVGGEGDVTLEAIVTNLDLSERYKLAWSLEGIDGAVEFGNTITFNTDDLPLGDYTLSVTVTDSGYPQMSDTAEMTVRVISNIPEPEETPDTTEAPATKKKSSGGSAQWFWLVIAAMAFVRRNRLAI